jgi:hypothetical protein
VLVRSEPTECLEAFGEVVGAKEGFEMAAELPMGVVMVSPDSGFLEGVRFIRSTWPLVQ